MKINWIASEKYFCTDESVKRLITDSISKNSTDSDLESRILITSHKTIKMPLSYWYYFPYLQKRTVPKTLVYQIPAINFAGLNSEMDNWSSWVIFVIRLVEFEKAQSCVTDNDDARSVLGFW